MRTEKKNNVRCIMRDIEKVVIPFVGCVFLCVLCLCY